MRILMVPMAARAQMQGPASRVRKLAGEFARRGHEVCVCAADDGNWQSIPGVEEYALTTPVPLGLPACIGNRAFRFASRMGASERVNVRSFEQVQFMTGALSERCFRTNVEEVRAAICASRPDALYSEFNFAALVAARIEGIATYGSLSLPARAGYASSPRFAKGVNRVLLAYGQSAATSTLELLERTDMSFVPSIPELEPMEDANVRYVGCFGSWAAAGGRACADEERAARDIVLVYLGNGVVAPKHLAKAVREAFEGSAWEVHVAGIDTGIKGLSAHSSAVPDDASTDAARTSGAGARTVHGSMDNVRFAPCIDFSALFGRTAVFVNHGGQNSVVDALVHGIPQVCFPGKVFERRFNARSIEAAGAGVVLDRFDGESLRRAVAEVADSAAMAENAAALGRKLMAAGGASAIVDYVS